MKDDQLKKMLTVRFVIPFKIAIGALVAAWLGPIIRQEPYSVETLTTIVDVVLYSTFACMLYMVGDYVCYQSLRIGKWIIRKLTNKKEDHEC